MISLHCNALQADIHAPPEPVGPCQVGVVCPLEQGHLLAQDAEACCGGEAGLWKGGGGGEERGVIEKRRNKTKSDVNISILKKYILVCIILTVCITESLQSRITGSKGINFVKSSFPSRHCSSQTF